MEEKNDQLGGRRLVLGFDAGCMTCSELAKRIEEVVGDKLELRSLNDPHVEHWRERALSKDAPWAPTLIEVRGAKVRAWTGVRMGVALGRRLGPRNTWRVMQALGQADTAPGNEVSSAPGTFAGLTRGQFLKSVGGSAVAFAALTGSSRFASPTFAQSGASKGLAEALKSARKTDIRGKELVAVARRAARSKDIVNIMGQAWSTGMRSGGTSTAEDGDETILVEDGRTSGADRQVVVGAARHTLRDGTILLIVVYRMRRDSKLLVYQEFDQPVPDGVGDLKSEATLHRAGDSELVLEKGSSNGSLETSESARLRCSGCSGSGGCRYRNRRCTRRSYRCFIATCSPCAVSCGPGLALLRCVGCALLACPYAWNFGCCTAVSYSSCRTCYRCF